MSSPATAAPAAPETAAAYSRRVPLIVAAAFFMETLDASVIVTALPAIAQSFGRAPLDLSLGISAYLLAVAVFVPSAGWMSERFGSRTVFAAAVGAFTVASLLCGLSPNFWTFIGSRVLQGAAAAFMSPVGRLVVLRETPKHRLIESIGLIVWPGLIGPVVGPPLGGLLATYASWRWIFFVNLPIGLVGLWLVLRYIPRHAPSPRGQFDLRGFVYTAVALVALIQGLSFVAESIEHRMAGGALIAAGIGVGWLALRHARNHSSPLIDLRAAGHSTFVLSTLSAGLLARVAIQATPFLLPLMFQIGFRESALHAGLMVLVYMVGNLVMKTTTTRLLRRFGFRSVIVVNGLLGGASLALCALLSPAWPLAFVFAVLVFAGMTRSMQFTALNTVGFADIAPDARAGATTIAAVAMQIGSALGVAFATVTLAASQAVAGAEQPRLVDFQFAFAACALLLVASALWSLRLPRDAGAEATSA